MVLDVGLEFILLTTALVLLRIRTLTSRDPEDRWVATDLKFARNKVVGSIDLSDTNLAAINIVLLGEFLPSRKKSLAVTAPWSITNDESISFSLGDNLIKSLTNNNLNFTGLNSSRNVLALDVLLSLAVNEALDEGLDLILVKSLDLTLVELLTVNDGNLILLILVEVHFLEVVIVVVSSNKVKLALEILGDRTETVEDVTKTSRIVLSTDLAVDEKNRERTIALPGVLIIDTSKRERSLLDPLTDGIGVVLARIYNFLILLVEVAVSDNLIRVIASSRSNTKDKVITKSIGGLDESLTNLGVSLGVGNELDVFLAFEELLKSILVVKRLGSGASLSTHVLHDTVSLTGTLVFTLLTLVEDIKSGITVDFETVGKISLNSAIDFTEDDTLAVLVEDISSLDEFRSKVLAVTTPGGVELNEHCFSLVNNLIEVILSKDNNLAILSYTESGKSQNCEDKE